jgi:RNA polymerase sigma factor (sigma-70 family)
MKNKNKEDIINKYTPMIHYIIKNYVSGDLAKELFSIGVMGLLQAIEQFKSTKNIKFSTYAHIKIKSAILDELRKQEDNITKTILCEDFIDSLLFAIFENTEILNPEDIILKREKIYQIRNIIENLEENLKKIIFLHYYNGYTIKKISELSNCSEQIIGRKHREALSIIKNKLEEKNG